MIRNARIGNVREKMFSKNCLFVFLETDQPIDVQSSGVLDSKYDCYVLVHDEIDKLDYLALELEKANKQVCLSRSLEELRERGIWLDQLNQTDIKILK